MKTLNPKAINYNSNIWIRKGKTIQIEDMTKDDILDFFVTTTKFVRANPRVKWYQSSTLYYLVSQQAEYLLGE